MKKLRRWLARWLLKEELGHLHEAMKVADETIQKSPANKRVIYFRDGLRTAEIFLMGRYYNEQVDFMVEICNR